jgi:S1-C subfamily serine protease
VIVQRAHFLFGLGAAIAAPLLFIVTSAANSASFVATTCANDVRTFCPGLIGGPLKECMKSHFSELSIDCQMAIVRAADVGRSCSADAEQFCSNVIPSKGTVAECMKAHASVLSPACREALAKAGGLGPRVAVSPTQPPAPRVEAPKGGPKQVSTGTGFFITNDGSILTNAHVVKDCTEIKIATKAGTFVPATLSAMDAINDLALLRADVRPNAVATFRLTSRLGEPVEAFGYPFVDLLSTSGNFSLGNISALSGLGDDSRYLQISVPVQPGNSGGPLLDQHGNVVGIVSEKLNAAYVMRTKGEIPENVNFALKASVAANFLQTNDVNFALGESAQVVEPPDLAKRAKAISVFVVCR